MRQARLLVIDDDHDLAHLTAAYAGEQGFDTHVCHDGSSLDKSQCADPEVIVLDMVMPGFDGVQVLRKLAEYECRAAIILCSSLGRGLLHSAERLTEELGLVLAGSLVKPFRRREFNATLQRASTIPRERTADDCTFAPELPNIDAGDLMVLFQPKIELATLDFSAVEALVRWQHPTLGMVGPRFFIPAAERSRQIDAITMAVFEKALEQCARWMRDGLVLRLSVNLSTRLLSDLTLPDRLEEAAARHGVRPESIVLEVTETWLNADQVSALDSLTRLRIKGFALSIDDFGTGYASLRQLSHFPFSELKIDRSFVSQAPYNDEARHILHSSVELGHRLGLNIVAEGVENQDQWNLIVELGCDECQGFFISRPLSADDTPAWLKRWRTIQGNQLDDTRLRIAG